MTDSKNEAGAVVPIRKAPLVAGRNVQAIVPQNIDEIWRFAQIVVSAGMAPKTIDTVEKATVAIAHGLEVGLTPMAALQSIAVINNTPTIFGDGMLALVRASGLLEDIIEEQVEDADGQCIMARCRVKRVGETTWGEQTITSVFCAKAGWLNKAGPWTLTRKRMMAIRARGWALRDKFADVLRGLHSAEEVQDMVDVTHTGSATTAPAEPTRAQFKESAQTAATGEQDAPAAAAADPASPPAASHTPNGGADNGQPAEDIPAGGGGDSKPEAPAKPGVTDVIDQNAQPEGEVFEFEMFRTFVAFNEFSDPWLRTASPAGAAAWRAFYGEKVKAFRAHKTAAIAEAAKYLDDLCDDALKATA